MENFLAFVLILVIAIGGFFMYTNSGTPVNEAPPAVTTEEKKPDTPAAPATDVPAPPAPAETPAATPAPTETAATTPAPATTTTSTTPTEPAKSEPMKVPEENIVALPSLDAETAKQIQEMMEKAKTATEAEKLELEKKATEMMMKAGGTTSAPTPATTETGTAPPPASTETGSTTTTAGTTDSTTASGSTSTTTPQPAGSSTTTEPAAPTTSAIREGTFTEIDAIHKGSGKAIVYPETADGPILRLENFEVTRGPDLYIYLSKAVDISSSSQLGEYMSLGALKSSKGDQNYKLPENHADYKSVVIWSQAFGVLFSSATMNP